MKHITINFRPEDEELYQWFNSLAKRWSYKSFTGREALRAYRKILELFGSEWEQELKRLEEVSREI